MILLTDLDVRVALQSMDLRPTSSWYYGVGNRQTGPVTLVELRHVLSRFPLEEFYVWNIGMADWKLAHDVPELKMT